MAYHGLGSEGLYRGIVGNIAKWTTISGDLTLDSITVTSLTVESGANLPAFDILTVNVGGTSALATVISGSWEASTIDELYGGTGQSSYVAGDILYSSAADTLSTLASGAEGYMLRVEGGAIMWSPLLQEIYGGTAQSAYAAGDILYSDATDSLARLASGDASEVLSVRNGTIGWSPAVAPLSVTIASESIYTMSNGENAVLASGAVLLELPASPQVGQQHILKDRLGTASTTNVVISGALIDGQPLQSLTQDYDSMSVLWDGVEWNITASG